MRNRIKQNGLFWGIFVVLLIFGVFPLIFLLGYHIWLESSCNEDSDATFLKSLEFTSKRTDIWTAMGKKCDLQLKACLINIFTGY